MLDLVSELARSVAAKLGLSAEPAFVRAAKPEFGDLQTNAALQLAKSLGKKPRDIAADIAAAIASHPAVEKTDIAGPGFVNVFLKDSYVAASVPSATKLRAIGAGQKVVIDFSSPNVAKPMHLGHIRSTILGDALQRTLRAVGYEVVGDNHIGDWGTQFGMLIVAWNKWLDAKAFAANPVAELVRLYRKFKTEEKAQGGSESDDDDAPKTVTPLLAEARAELVKLQAGDATNVALWTKFIEVSRKEFDRVYTRLGVKFDVTHGESFYNDRLASTVQMLLDKGIAKIDQGAAVVFFDKATDGAELPPYIVRKADGGYNYATSDIAGLEYRMETWNPSRILIVTDERQQLHFRQLFAVGRRLGVQASLEHLWFGMMTLDGKVIQTREGEVISLESMLDEAEARSLAVATESNPELSEAERREVARVVGIGAIKYNDLSRERQSAIDFVWERALALSGNTAPYLQYAYARTRSILRKGAADGAEPGEIGALNPVERRLAMQLLAYGEIVETVARTTRPHHLCEYLFALAQLFSAFFNECPVLKAEPAVRASRLRLCAIVAETLAAGLHLLGIETLERM
jgi:arginyl-tRNA synthetase